MQLFGTNLAGSDHFTALMGSGTIVMLYFATRLFFDRRTAWLTALVLLADGCRISESSRTGLLLVDRMVSCCVVYWQCSRMDGKQANGGFMSAQASRWDFVGIRITPAKSSRNHFCAVVGTRSHPEIGIWFIVGCPRLTLMWCIALLIALPMWWSIATHWDHLYRRFYECQCIHQHRWWWCSLDKA
jgi:dolichyl-phosphate-mannose--protein O-mannosyl transferase